ncbi:MAG TPA: efflux RND transporter periplasmic adaptor subunit [Myxococcota bacterium]|nr:efflux RND transporter periplasmic adaptor subunit [Myxococcota bacterium]HOS62084.1 efflux RND transporter periplasmic adaptor subunit [Myxococcota bacterium]HPC91013.1 efflux RND transporter periplasmic adaptor subunit [Myxococcota bacterium]HPL25224.1 efflux RND transporter periplasmic adaptor subunit [Myxococcota bacterium]HQE74083.1 efflux RND transporter periplasmic adaptor subunit [Myxococcota bacterium]
MTRKVWLVLLGALAVGFVAVFGWRLIDAIIEKKAAEKGIEAAIAPVSVTEVEIRDIVLNVTMTGTIKPRLEAPIFAKVPGRVQEVHVAIGDEVTADQVLAVIEHREIELQANQAKAGVKVAEAQLERAKNGVAAATSAYNRLQELKQNEAIPDAEFEKIEFSLRDAKASLLAAEAGVATARAASELANQMVENANVTTPIDGIVTHRFVNVGSPTGQTTPVFMVQDLAELKLDSNVTAKEFAMLKVGQEVKVTVPDLPGQEFPGEVETLSPSLNPMTRHAGVEITIANYENRMLPNMFATAVVEALHLDDVVAIPKKAIVGVGAEQAVFVVKEGKAVRVKPVFGSSDLDFIAVESELIPGDVVVVSGHGSLKDGDPVKIVDHIEADALVESQSDGGNAKEQNPSPDEASPDEETADSDDTQPPSGEDEI